MSPQRIQRKRTKGWRMPEGAIYVGRGSTWGNPWRVGGRLMTHYDLPDGDQYGREFVITPEIAVALYQSAFAPDELEARAELGGHDLMCWCPLEDSEGRRAPCHADVLLELANPGLVINERGCRELAELRAKVERVRELHYAADNDPSYTPICPDCQGRAGVHPCGCWSESNREAVCGHCREGWKGASVTYPCPTLRALDGEQS